MHASIILERPTWHNRQLCATQCRRDLAGLKRESRAAQRLREQKASRYRLPSSVRRSLPSEYSSHRACKDGTGCSNMALHSFGEGRRKLTRTETGPANERHH